jgi:hypothetical protein
VAPAGRWSLVGPSGTADPRSSSFGWAAQYRVAAAGTAILRFDGGPWAPLGVLVELVLWLAVAAALIERRGVVRPWVRAVARRSQHRPAGPDPIPGLADEPTGDLQAGADG